MKQNCKEAIMVAMTEAAHIMTDNALRKEDVHEKSGVSDLVTTYDVAVQSYLLKRLAEIIPEACFYAEEKSDNVLTDAPTFIIDPIDGTSNFVHGLRHSCISVALFENRMPVLGFVLNPYMNELFYAEKGNGAFLRAGGTDTRLSVSNVPLSHALISFGTDPYRIEQYGALNAALFGEALRAGIDVRRMGSAAIDLSYIAAGRFDVFYETGLSLWDYAAVWLIVTEAGGVLTDFDGNLPDFTKCSILAGSPAIVKEFREKVIEVARKKCIKN